MCSMYVYTANASKHFATLILTAHTHTYTVRKLLLSRFVVPCSLLSWLEIGSFQFHHSLSVCVQLSSCVRERVRGFDKMARMARTHAYRQRAREYVYHPKHQIHTKSNKNDNDDLAKLIITYKLLSQKHCTFFTSTFWMISVWTLLEVYLYPSRTSHSSTHIPTRTRTSTRTRTRIFIAVSCARL